MKKISLMFLRFIGVIILLGCSATKSTTSTNPATTSSVTPAIPPVYWKQDMDKFIEVGDPVNLYNEFAIDVVVNIPIVRTVFKDGDRYNVDSTKTMFIPIEKLTRGTITNIRRNNHQDVVGLVVSFQERIDYLVNDINHYNNYELKFILNNKDKTYYLIGAKEILYDGVYYNANVFIHGNGSGDCRLMIYNHNVNKTTNITNPASGTDKSYGTKIVKDSN